MHMHHIFAPVLLILLAGNHAKATDGLESPSSVPAKHLTIEEKRVKFDNAFPLLKGRYDEFANKTRDETNAYFGAAANTVSDAEWSKKAAEHMAFLVSLEEKKPTQFQATEAKAQKGDAVAMFCLGNYYKQGKGVPKDYVKAQEWFGKAAKSKDPLMAKMSNKILARRASWDDDVKGSINKSQNAEESFNQTKQNLRDAQAAAAAQSERDRVNFKASIAARNVIRKRNGLPLLPDQTPEEMAKAQREIEQAKHDEMVRIDEENDKRLASGLPELHGGLREYQAIQRQKDLIQAQRDAANAADNVRSAIIGSSNRAASDAANADMAKFREGIHAMERQKQDNQNAARQQTQLDEANQKLDEINRKLRP